MMAAVNEKIKKAAAFERAISKAAMSADGGSTVSTVLWESRADADDRAGSNGDGRVDAASGAAATIGSMQVVEEAIEATDLRGATGCGALPTDGGVWQQLERELECARSEQAEQVLWGETYSWKETGSEGYEGSSAGRGGVFLWHGAGGLDFDQPKSRTIKAFGNLLQTSVSTGSLNSG
jgi:hypothetical protein